jgi:hypothetical protein
MKHLLVILSPDAVGAKNPRFFSSAVRQQLPASARPNLFGVD